MHLFYANYDNASSGDGQEEAEVHMQWHARTAGQGKETRVYIWPETKMWRSTLDKMTQLEFHVAFFFLIPYLTMIK